MNRRADYRGCAITASFALVIAAHAPIQVPTRDLRMLLLLAGLFGAFGALRLRRG